MQNNLIRAILSFIVVRCNICRQLLDASRARHSLGRGEGSSFPAFELERFALVHQMYAAHDRNRLFDIRL
jgi:hypothetical protein